MDASSSDSPPGRGIALPEVLLVLLGLAAVGGLLVIAADRPDGPLLGSVALALGTVVVAVAGLAYLAVRRAVRTAEAIDHGARLLEGANRELALSRQRFRDFAEAASDWFWESDAEHRYTYVSERLAGIIGREAAVVFGSSLRDLGRLCEDAQTWEEYRADIEAGRPFRDLEVTHQDEESAQTFVFRLSGQPVFDESGAFAGYRGSGLDVTVETMAMMDARFMQVVVHDALDSISEGFVLFNADGRLLMCNDRYRQAYPNIADILVPGVTFEEILRAAAERGGYDGGGDLTAWVRDRLNRHLEHDVPVDRRLSDGCWYRISEHATGAGGVVKILMDITELKLRENELAGQTERLEATVGALQESENRYKQLVELAPYGIAIWDGTAIRFANASAASILGAASFGGLEGAELKRFFHEGPALEARLVPAADGIVQRLECEVQRPSGERRHLEMGAYPVTYQREPAVLLVMNDITERRRAEEELQRSQKMEAVGRMAGGIAHEFNNMLTAIGGFARLAERAPGDEARVLTCVREIAKASDRAAALTAQLLDFSRRKASEETEVVPLADLVRDLRVFLKPLMSAGIAIDFDIRDSSVHAVANPVTLNQAILNLALNARDAMPDGGTLRVSLESVEPDRGFFERHESLAPGRYAVIRVADSGCGVPEAIRDRIWEPFFTTKEPGKGTGLGLWMVYGTAQQAGGVVEMESELGQGTMFTLYLPAVAPPAAEDDGGETVRLPEGETASILLVDDEESVRSYLRLTLEEAGCAVVEAEDGLDALARWDEHGGLFDLLVTDVSMPRMTGPELARALEERNPALRMLFLTGYASQDQAAGLTARPGCQLLMKPIGPDKLVQAVRELLSE